MAERGPEGGWGAQRGLPPRSPRAGGEPFPFDAVRDLLGVVRAIYASARESGAGRNDLSRIAKVGQELSRALDLAGSAQQGSSDPAADPHPAADSDPAWRCLEGALREASELVDPLTPAAPIVQAARSRIANFARGAPGGAPPGRRGAARAGPP